MFEKARKTAARKKKRRPRTVLTCLGSLKYRIKYSLLSLIFGSSSAKVSFGASLGVSAKDSARVFFFGTNIVSSTQAIIAAPKITSTPIRRISTNVECASAFILTLCFCVFVSMKVYRMFFAGVILPAAGGFCGVFRSDEKKSRR